MSDSDTEIEMQPVLSNVALSPNAATLDAPESVSASINTSSTADPGMPLLSANDSNEESDYFTSGTPKAQERRGKWLLGSSLISTTILISLLGNYFTPLSEQKYAEAREIADKALGPIIAAARRENDCEINGENVTTIFWECLKAGNDSLWSSCKNSLDDAAVSIIDDGCVRHTVTDLDTVGPNPTTPGFCFFLMLVFMAFLGGFLRSFRANGANYLNGIGLVGALFGIAGFIVAVKFSIFSDTDDAKRDDCVNACGTVIVNGTAISGLPEDQWGPDHVDGLISSGWLILLAAASAGSALLLGAGCHMALFPGSSRGKTNSADGNEQLLSENRHSMHNSVYADPVLNDTQLGFYSFANYGFGG